MALTNTEIRNLKPAEKPYKISDGGGLHIQVQPNGSKLWRLSYRVRGQQKLISFGPYPAVSLIEAREKREEAKRTLRDGKDPVEVRLAKEHEAIKAKGNTFRIAAEEYIAHRSDVSNHTRSVYNWYVADILGNEFCDRPLDTISPGVVSTALLKVHHSGRQETARRVRFFIGRVFQYAKMRGRATGDPTQTLKGVLPPRVKKSYAAIIVPEKLGALVAVIEEYDGWPTLRWALQIAALCFVRPGEIRGATWKEIDLENSVWHIPGERMKMKRAHDVPLSRQAKAVFLEAKRLGAPSGLIFPQIRNLHRPISENAMNVTLRRMGYTKDEHTSHGFRSSASTILNGAGFRHDVIERQLAHLEPNEVRRVYNRQEYWSERVTMMQAWADMLDKFKVLSLN